MKALLAGLALPLLVSCTSSYEKAILREQENYHILQTAEFAVVQSSYASLYTQPTLKSKVENLLRKNAIVRILFTKLSPTNEPLPRTWYYVENILNPSEKGWLQPYEITLSPNMYHASLLIFQESS